MDWYKHYPGDYMSDTAHLSLLEHGAYRLMLDHYYSTQKPLPADKTRIYRLVRAVDTHEMCAVDAILNEYFVLTSEGYQNNKCNEIIEKYEAQAEHNREIGRLGGRPKKPGLNPEHNPEITQPVSETKPGNNPIQILDTRYQILDNQKQERVADKPPKSNRFEKPTLPEIRAYCESIKASINPVTFYNHYETVGWKVGKNQMKDWKAAIRGWNSRDAK